jgi:flagellar basal-body rod protein FlgB
MYNGLAFFKVASALAGHAAARQSVIAQNIANADTPGYQARDLPEFSAQLTAGNAAAPMRATRDGHMTAAPGGPTAEPRSHETRGDASPNGNTVSLETEMIKSTAVRHQHELALATYRSGMDLLRTALGRGR